MLAFPHEENIKAILEEKVAVLQVYWGDFPKEMVDQAHEAGVKVIHQVFGFVPFPLHFIISSFPHLFLSIFRLLALLL